MNLQQDFEAIAMERTRAWDKEVGCHQLRVQVPRNVVRWHRWMGHMMVTVGTWLALR